MSVLLDRNRNELPRFHRQVFFKKRSSYALVIPVLNEGARIQRQLEKMVPYSTQVDIIIVDGNSSDQALSQSFLKKCGVRVFFVMTGSGRQGAQLRIGISEALDEDYRGVIFMDGNDKDDPSGIEKMIQALDQGFDFVQGSRFVPGGVSINLPWYRLAGIRLIHAPILSIFSRFRYTDTTNGFRGFSRRFLVDPRVAPLRAVFIGYELHYYLALRAPELGFRTIEIPVSRIYPSNEVPTKIKGMRGNLNVIFTLLRACFGKYHPKEFR